MHPVEANSSTNASYPYHNAQSVVGQTQYRRPKNDDSTSILRSPSPQCTKSSIVASPIFAAPKLTHPEKINFDESKLLHIIDDIYSTGQSLTSALASNIQQATTKLKELTIEKMQMLEAAANKTQSSEFWSVLKKIGECILAAFTAIMGMTLISTGPVALGAVMIASGILTIVNFTMKESGAWESITKKLAKDHGQDLDLARYLPMGISLVTAILSVGSGAATTLWTAASITQKAVAIAMATLGIYNATTGAAKAITDASLAWTQAELTAKDSEINQSRIKLDMSQSQLTHITKIIDQIQQAAEGVIELYTQAVKRTMLHV